jgi:tetratricopeptide (TPR) repeat protein
MGKQRFAGLCGLVLGAALTGGAVSAQPQGQAPRPTPITPGGRSANPAHERAKMDAERAYQQGEFEQAIELTTQVINQNSRDHVAFYLRASARVELGRVTDDAAQIRAGIADARESVRLGGGDNVMFYLPYIYGMTSLSEVEDRDSHAKAALTVVGQLIDRPGLSPQDKSNLLYQRAMTHMFLEDFPAAQRDYAEAVKVNPQHLGAYTGLAEAHAATGNSEQALEAFNSAIRAFPDAPLVYNNRGMYRQQQGDTQKAVEDFTQAVRLEPNYFVAYTNRGYAKLEAGRVPDAIADLTQSLQINPNQPMVYSLRGTAHLLQTDAQSAIADYTRALQMEPENPIALADLGFARCFAGDNKGALEAFEKALNLEPALRYLEPWRLLVAVRMGQGDSNKDKFRSRVTEDPQKRDWIDHLLRFQLEETSPEQLLEAVEKTDKDVRTAQLCEAHYYIGQHHLRAGRRDEAAKSFRQSIETNARYLSAYRGAQFELKGRQ